MGENWMGIKDNISLEDWFEVFRHMNQAIIIADGEGKLLFCTEQYLKTCRYDGLGITTENIVGMSMKELLAKGELEESQSTILECLRRKEEVCRIFQAPLYKVVMSTAIPIKDQAGNIKMVYAIVLDESEIFRRSEKSEKVRAMYAEYLKSNKEKSSNRPIIVSNSMQQIMGQCMVVGNSDLSILITGESGVGKDVISHFIHDHSERKDKPFLAINCGAIPENLIESELFGYAPGAFTGASKNGKMGIFEAANNGTVMLDEIGDLSLHMQVKLLRVLENRQVTRVGSVRPIQVDFRLISATNKNLPEKVRKGEFREDLYYRINSFRINIPPLRERMDDVTALAAHYLAVYNLKYKRDVRLSADAFQELAYYKWPGNIRELRNVMEQVVVLSTDNQVNADTIKGLLFGEVEQEDGEPVVVKRLMPLKEAVAITEKRILEMAREAETSSYKAAKILKVDQTTVLRKMKKYHLEGFQSD